MNCPECKQPVGHDAYNVGEWREERDANDAIIACFRTVVVDCGHCGLFEMIHDSDSRIRKITGPYRNAKDVRRLAKLIPARRHDRRVPA